MIHQRVILVDITLVAFHGVLEISASLLHELRGDEVATGGEDAKHEASDEGGKGGHDDHPAGGGLVTHFEGCGGFGVSEGAVEVEGFNAIFGVWKFWYLSLGGGVTWVVLRTLVGAGPGIPRTLPEDDFVMLYKARFILIISECKKKKKFVVKINLKFFKA